MENTVVIFGAGATKACNGPLTNEILFDAFTPEVLAEIEREDYTVLLEKFLVENFHLPPNQQDRRRADYPPLPLLMSLIDTAFDRGQPFGTAPDRRALGEVRAALDYTVFAVLEYRLRRLQRPTPYERMLDVLYAPPVQPQVISLNYDIIVDNVMIAIGEQRGLSSFPNYFCDIRSDAYAGRPERFGKLLKLHGSLHWLYCPGCHRLDIAVSQSGRSFAKALEDLYQVDGAQSLEDRYTCHGSPCRDCGVFVRPVMITPTQKKDYRNPHISRVWYEAERMLRTATSAVFVGYSLPEDDVEVAYLLKRGLNHLTGDKITVVEYDPSSRSLQDNPVGLRYRTLFGNGLQWNHDGFLSWVERQELTKQNAQSA